MAALASLLPKPKHEVYIAEVDDDEDEDIMAPPHAKHRRVIPPYGQRQGWVPRALEDFGDGGAFPEIQVAQFPLNMGKSRVEGEVSSALTLQVDGSGKLQYDALARQGHSEKRIVHSKVDAVKPKDMTQTFEKPDDDDVRKATEETRLALEKIVSSKIKAATPTQSVGPNREPDRFIRYTPAHTNEAHAAGASQRVIRMVEAPVDPLEPPKFRHKRLPKGPPSPPPPVLHSPPRKVTVKEQNEWKIPPCISNWKNPKGFTIPLDKRLAADGRGLQEIQINDNFAKLAQTLYIADRQAREEIAKRENVQRMIAQKEKEMKEEKLRALAAQARDERSGLSLKPGTQAERPEDLAAEREREKLRRERQKEIERDMRMNNMGKDTKSKVLARAMDRDISEKIALGLAAPTLSKEMMYDQRLFNQASSASTNASHHDDESYSLYDKPLFAGSSSSQLYRPKKGGDEELYGSEADMAKLRATDRFQPDKGFQGADQAQRRDGPVEFEKQEADPFGLDQFLTNAKQGKRPLDNIGSRGQLAASAGTSFESSGRQSLSFESESKRARR